MPHSIMSMRRALARIRQTTVLLVGPVKPGSGLATPRFALARLALVSAVVAMLGSFADIRPAHAGADPVPNQAHTNVLSKLRPDVASKLNRRLHRINDGPGTRAQKRQKMRERFDKTIRSAENDLAAAKQFGSKKQQDKARKVIDVLKSYKSAFFGGATTDKTVQTEEKRLRKAEADKKKKEAGKKPASTAAAPPLTSVYDTPLWATSLAVDVGGSRTDYDGVLTSSFGTDARDGSKEEDHSIGGDLRVPMANLGPNTDVVAGGWARINFGGMMRILQRDLHPTSGQDTFLKAQKNGFLLFYLGIRYKYEHTIQGLSRNIDNCSAFLACGAIFTLFAGPRLQFNKLTLIADESGGGGIRNTFTKSQTKVGATAGFDVEIPLFGRRPGMPGWFVRWGGALDFTPQQKVSGRSTTGRTYSAKVKSQTAGRLFIGVGVNLP